MTTAATIEPTNTRTRQPHTAPPDRRGGGLSLTAIWTLYLLTLRQHLRGKRWMVMGALFLLPAGLAILLRLTTPNVPGIAMEFMFACMFIQALLPLVALLYASGMIQDEQEEQTLTYLLIRPIPKWALYLSKLLATLTTTVLLTVLFTVMTYAAIYVGSETQPANVVQRCCKAASINALAVVSYCCLFGLISLLTKRTLVMGIVYAAVFEGLLANLPLSIRLVTVIYYIRIIAYRTLPFLVPLPGGGVEPFAAEVWQLDIANDPMLLEHPTLGTCVKVLLIASVICTILAAVLCSRREFHVKTPEKS